MTMQTLAAINSNKTILHELKIIPNMQELCKYEMM